MMNLDNIQLSKHKTYQCFDNFGRNPIDVHVSLVDNEPNIAFLSWSHDKILNMEYTFEMIKAYYPVITTYLIAIWDWDTINQSIILNLGFVFKDNGIINNLNILIYQIIL